MRLGDDSEEGTGVVHRHPSPWSQGSTPWLERSRATRAWKRLLSEGLHPSTRATAYREPTSVAGLLSVRRQSAPERLARVPLPDAVEAPIEPYEPPPTRAPTPAPVAPAPVVPPRWSGDPVAQAAALRSAAQTGAPFCAVCEQARLEQEALDRAEEEAVAEAQAATLVEAAEEGAPFCEECEAARRAQGGT